MGRHRAVNRTAVTVERSFARTRTTRNPSTVRAQKKAVTASVRKMTPADFHGVEYQSKMLHGRQQRVMVPVQRKPSTAKRTQAKSLGQIVGLFGGASKRKTKTSFTGKRMRIW